MFKLTAETASDPLAVTIAAQCDLGNERVVVPAPYRVDVESQVGNLLASQGLVAVGVGYFGNVPNVFYQFQIRKQ